MSETNEHNDTELNNILRWKYNSEQYSLQGEKKLFLCVPRDGVKKKMDLKSLDFSSEKRLVKKNKEFWRVVLFLNDP